MKPFFRAIFLIVLFLTFNGLFLWQDDIGNFLKSDIFQASIGRFLPERQDQTTKTEIEPVFETEEIAEDQNSTTSEENTLFLSNKEGVFSLADIQEQIDDISEKVDVLNQKVGELAKENSQNEELAKEEIEKTEEEMEEVDEEKQEQDEEEEAEEEIDEDKEQIEVGQEVGQSFCDKNLSAFPLQNSVIINEIAWMGSQNSANDEWIELKNISNQDVDLMGWQILSQSDNIKFIFPKGAKLLLGGILFLERTNDDSVPAISADFIYTGALKNSEETLYLFGSDCQLQDRVVAGADWPAGQNDLKRTMERKGDLDWQTSLNFGGTPKMANSSGYFVVPTGGGAPPPEPAKPTYPKILISEVKISEQRGDKNIFIELYNPNDAETNLTDWYLQRKTASSSEFSSFVPKNSFTGQKIPTKSYFLLARQESELELTADLVFDDTLTENNTIILKNPNQEITDEARWQAIEAGISWGKIYDEQNLIYIEPFEVQAITPKDKNNRLPLAYFSFFPESPKEKEEILFDASSSSDPDGTVTSFLWDFGDNSSTTTDLATTTHIYESFGELQIVLETTDDRGATSSATSSILIVKIPQAVLEISPTSFSFRGEQEENIAGQTLAIENKGDGDLNWTISSVQDWLTLNPISGTTPVLSSSTIGISVNTLNLDSGNYLATATIEAEDCQNCPQEISVELTLFPKTEKSVVINEIAWMGNETSSNNEWFELYNSTDVEIDLNDWKFASLTDNSPDITLSGVIPPFGFYLLERTDDNSVEEIPADLIYTGSLNNEGEKLELKDNLGNLIDLVDCSVNWFSGDNSLKQTMERIEPLISGSDPENWQNSQEPGGTPKSKSSASP